MAQQTFTGSTQAKSALLDKIQPNDTELYLTKAEVEAARDGEANLLTKINAMDTATSEVAIEVSNARKGETTLEDKIDAMVSATSTVTSEVTAARDGQASLAAKINLLNGTVSEVETARGVEANLNARLDGIDDDITALGSAELPGQTGNANKFLATSGSASSWAFPFDVQGSDIASASTITIPTDGRYFDITGTTDITGINTTGKIGNPFALQFDGELTLTHHSTDLILPNGANIKTYAGLVCEFREYATGKFILSGSNITSGKQFLYSVTASAASEVVFDDGITSAFRKYTIESDDFELSASNTFFFHVGTGASPTYQTTNYSYTYRSQRTNSSTITISNVTNATDGHCGYAPGPAPDAGSFVLKISNPSSSTERTVIESNTVVANGTDQTQAWDAFSSWKGTDAVTAIKLFPASGTITGTFKLFGEV